MKRLAICVGLTHLDPDAYGGWDGDCPGCDRDVARFAALCHDKGFDGVTCFVNEAANKTNIKMAFVEASKRLVASDLLVLFNSGHGGQQRDIDGDEEDGQDETLCWWDGEVVDDQISVYLRKLPKDVRVLFVTDTCNSGTNYRGMRRIKRSTPVKLPRRATNGFRGSLLHFGGCADGRLSYGADQGGEFTIALLDVLAKARKPLSYQVWFERTAVRMAPHQIPVCAVRSMLFSLCPIAHLTHNVMTSWKLWTTLGILLMGAGDIPLPGEADTYIQFGALGILFLAVVKLFAELSNQRHDAKEERETHSKIVGQLCDRWDGWEKTRHSDHELLTRTLTELRTHCAEIGTSHTSEIPPASRYDHQ